MPGVRLKIDKSGMDELKFILGGLNKKDAKNAARRTFAALARHVKDDLKAVEPRRMGGLRKGTKSRQTSGGGSIVYGEHPQAAHAAIVRKGTTARVTRKGRNRGKMPANADMQGVLDRAVGEYAHRAASELAQQVAASIYGRVKSGKVRK